MENAIFIALAVVLLSVAWFVWFLLMRGPPLYRRLHSQRAGQRNEKVASRFLALALLLGAVVALTIAAWSVL